MEGILMTVRIEYMIVNVIGSVINNWTTCEGSVQNDPQIYVSRGYQAVARFSQGMTGLKARVRIVDEQTNRIVDIIQ
jgi:hypothetical protein